MLSDGRFAFVVEIRVDEMLLCDVVSCRRLENVFKAPTESKNFNIGWIRNLNRHIKRRMVERRMVERREIKCKVVSLPYGEGQALFPMLHEIERP